MCSEGSDWIDGCAADGCSNRRDGFVGEVSLPALGPKLVFTLPGREGSGSQCSSDGAIAVCVSATQTAAFKSLVESAGDSDIESDDDDETSVVTDPYDFGDFGGYGTTLSENTKTTINQGDKSNATAALGGHLRKQVILNMVGANDRCSERKGSRPPRTTSDRLERSKPAGVGNASKPCCG